MAPGRNKPPDKCRSNFACCKQKPATTAVCVICDEAYHLSCLKNKNENFKFIGNNLIVCSEHSDRNITSKIDEDVLSESASLLIAQIKLKKSEDVRYDLLAETSNKTQDLQETDSIDESDLELLKTENMLLRRLVSELTEKNDLLKEKLQNTRSKTDNNVLTYSDAMKYSRPIHKKIPKISVRKNNNSNIDVMKSVIECLTAEKNIQTKNIYVNKNEEVIISCLNENSAVLTETVLKEKLEDQCDVMKNELNNPKIKILGIDNHANMDIKDIEKDINERNFSYFEKGGQVLHMYKNNYNSLSTVIMEVPADIYKHIRENNNKVFVGYQQCKAYDLVNVCPCFKCGRFGHSARKCQNEFLCLKCSGKHNTCNCDKDYAKCINCHYSNTKYKSKLDTKHHTYDSNLCSILKKKIDRYIDSIDYPIKPTLPETESIYHSIELANRRKVSTEANNVVDSEQQENDTPRNKTKPETGHNRRPITRRDPQIPLNHLKPQSSALSPANKSDKNKIKK
ncbi:uncharacterized protein LOC100115389 isoform X1 [Nasonia vitripennis]|uniref:CCHC-type domain-containing protein n=1 Tax=Nasonia vitripennis TaxID=7425 RepID=A0A7M7Q169_NASVI|nr:uncharacterized protein LOC100115389 isoform X1 [Nasonia vitripennis]